MNKRKRNKTLPRIIIITGGANGIGYFLAKALLEQGDRVAILDIYTGETNLLGMHFPETFLFLFCNVTADEDVQKSVQKVLDKWGIIDILINNACSAIFKKFEERTIQSIQQELDVNLFGYIRTIQSVLPAMRKQGSGIIHNFTSGVGITGFSELTGYTASKGAIEALTKTLALELAADSISVNLIHPPLTRTRSSAPLGYQLAQRIGSKKKIITPDFKSTVFVWLSYRFPYAIGKFLSGMTQKARNSQAKDSSVSA
jgi:NAD(P)-dependent dehydrogenase (short-subunit alcohol dehydrogenase family)